MIEWELIKLEGKTYLNIWDPVMQQRKSTYSEIKNNLRQLRVIEKKLNALKGLAPYVGGWAIWILHSKPSHKKMIEKLGAKKLLDTQDRTWFIKEVL